MNWVDDNMKYFEHSVIGMCPIITITTSYGYGKMYCREGIISNSIDKLANDKEYVECIRCHAWNTEKQCCNICG